MKLTAVKIIRKQHDHFDDWRWLGSLDGDENRLEELRKCCENNALEVELGTDGLDIFCQGKRSHIHIAYGMFCILQYQLDKELAKS